MMEFKQDKTPKNLEIMKTLKFMFGFGLCVALTSIVVVGVFGVIFNLLKL